MDVGTLFFFDGKPDELALYEAFLDKLTALGEFTTVAHKTQISLKNRRVFGCILMMRVLRKALLRPLDSPRIAAVTEARPNRWTHHIVVGSENELDEELLAWVREAYDCGNR